MENKFHGLPPLKRFRLMQQEQQRPKPDDDLNPPLLPAKKRKESRKLPPPPPSAATTTTTVSTYSLPAKKRVWALSPFDLNIEYNPFINDEEQSKSHEAKNVLDVNHNIQLAENGKEKSDGYENPLLDEDQSNTQEVKTALDLNQNIQLAENGKEKRDRYENPLPDEDQNNTQEAKNVLDLNHNIQEKREGCENEAKSSDNEDEDDGILCSVCQSTDGDPSDPIVFCDGCDLMVHTTCYGSPLINGVPEGDWFCTQCLAKNKNKPISCCLCPITGGAMKPTGDGQWAHIVCALLVPEVFFTDPEGRQGIDVSKVPPRRWEQRCFVCKSESGCSIDCSEPKCDLAFHVTCGLNEDLCIEYREGRKKGAVVAGFCKEHTELWKKQESTGKFKIVARDENKI